MANTVQIMGLGGSLRAASTSRTALEVALQATTAARAHARLVWVRDLDLPLYTADLPVPRPVREFVDAVYACDGRCGAGAFPLVQPVAQSWRSFDRDGRLADDAVAGGGSRVTAVIVTLLAIPVFPTDRPGPPAGATRRAGRLVAAARPRADAGLLATNNHLPHLYALRDDRKVFASGIWTIAVLSGTLLVAVREG